MKTGELILKLVGHKDSVTCFAREAWILLSGSDDNSII
jgi:hypothetical protein